jgi:hypothetical protein
VRNDGTIIVIHSGNYEVIGIRHRESQTLYISDVIEPPTCKNPAYGKLHTGIYIAAIKDAMDRAKQLLDKSQPQSLGDDEDPSHNNKDENEDDPKGNLPEGNARGGRRDDGGGGRRGDRRSDGGSSKWLKLSEAKGGRGGPRQKATNAGEMAAREVRFSGYPDAVMNLASNSENVKAGLPP